MYNKLPLLLVWLPLRSSVQLEFPSLQTEAPHTAIFDEFAFDTVTTAPSTVPAPSYTGTPASTHFTTSALSPTTQKSTTAAAATEFPPMPEESDEVEYDEEEGRAVTKGRPASFGGENISRTETKPAVPEEESTPHEEQAPESATARSLEVGPSATTAAAVALTASAASSTTRLPSTSTERAPAPTAAEAAAPAPTASVASAKTLPPASSGETVTKFSVTNGITTPSAFFASSHTSSPVSSPEVVTTFSATTGTASSSAVPEGPPFEAIPGMFEESGRPTVAHREPTAVGRIAEQMVMRTFLAYSPLNTFPLIIAWCFFFTHAAAAMSIVAHKTLTSDR